MSIPTNRIMSASSIGAWAQKLKARGRKIVLTNGCFDLLHRGHLEFLYAASLLGDKLVVALNSDASVKQLKGPSRPFQGELDRAVALASLRFVSRVCIFDSTRCDAEILLISPSVYAKAGDYTLEKLDSAEFGSIKRVGAAVEFLPFVHGYSTTNTAKNISNN